MTTPDELLKSVQRIGPEVAAKWAPEVDRDARFPRETLAALKEAKVLSAAIPTEFGGGGCGIEELGQQCWELGQHCASSGMVLAMHHIQVVSITRHLGEGSAWFEAYLRRCVDEQRLIASVTSEVGPSGDMRTSVCAVELDGDALSLNKHATTMSYGEHAEDLLLSARRAPDAAPNDQVLVLGLKDGVTLTDLGVWDTLGMRGTCSPGGRVAVKGVAAQVVPRPFAEIASQTVVPYSHILWSHCWLGVATDAVRKARKMIRAKARKSPGSAAPVSVSQLNQSYELLRSTLAMATAEYAALEKSDPDDTLSSVGYALSTNNLKLNTSEGVVDVVTRAMRVVGIMGYKNDSEFSLGRNLRDAHSAALMINNERIAATNASLLQVHKGD